MRDRERPPQNLPEPPGPAIPLAELREKTLKELKALAEQAGVEDYATSDKTELSLRILAAEATQQGTQFVRGILEIMPEGYGFLRVRGFLPSPEDIYVSQSQIRRFGLRTGDRVAGVIRPPKSSERYSSLLRVEAVNNDPPEVARARKNFDELTPCYPTEMFDLETDAKNISGRFINLIAPIGRGQRALIVSPPKAGKTTLLKVIGNSIKKNSPETHLLVLLVDERPEEVTDIKRSLPGEVISSTFDEMPEHHMRVQKLCLEHAKRLVEQGKHVVILLDSLTRLSRASNLTVTPSGRTLSGGLDPAALHRPKQLFGAARNVEEGGSLTIVATCLVDTGSRMDDAIFEEFKATGNMELVLDRTLSERRIFPSIDIKRSGTRHEELLLPEKQLRRVWQLRRVLNALEIAQATEMLLTGLNKTDSNEDFLNWVEKELTTDDRR